MSSIRLCWRQQGHYVGFDVYRDTRPMNPSDLPTPIATGLTAMSYEDFDISPDRSYYYRVMVRRPGGEAVSQQIIVETIDNSFPKDIELLFDENLIDNVSGTVWQDVGTVPVTYSTDIKGYQSTTSAYLSGGAAIGSVASVPPLDFDAGPFTMNIDAYRIPPADTWCMLIGGGTTYGTIQGLRYINNKSIAFDTGSGTYTVAAYDVTPIQVWNNIKALKSNGVLYLYVNDILVSSNAHNYPINLNRTFGGLFGGVWDSSGSPSSNYHFNGYIDNFYALTNRARFPETVTPPTLAMDFEHKLLNLGTANNAFTFYGGGHVTTMLGESVMACTDAYMNANGAVNTLITKDLYFRCRFYNIGNAANRGLISYTHIFYIAVNANGEVVVCGNNSGLQTTVNGWNELIVNGVGDNIEVILNGVVAMVPNISPMTITELMIGSYHQQSGGIGYISEIEFYSSLPNGVVATNKNLVVDIPFNNSKASYLVTDRSGRHVWNPMGYTSELTNSYKGRTCLRFNGSTQYVETIHSTDLTLTGGPALISFDILIESTTINRSYFLLGDKSLEFFIGMETYSGIRRFIIGSGGSSDTLMTESLLLDQWMNLRVKYDKDKNLEVFLDNKSVFRKTGLDKLRLSSANGTLIGYNSTFSSVFFNGYMANFKVLKGTDDITGLIDETTSYEDRVLTYKPVAYWPMEINDTSSGVPDLSVSKLDAEQWLTQYITYNNPPLRYGHAGAPGFNIDNSSGKAYVWAPTTGSEFNNLTKKSFSWCVWIKPTDLTSYNFIFANWTQANAANANMRATLSDFVFPTGTRSITWPAVGVDTVAFVAVVYDVASMTYRAFVNGTWYNGTYYSPPTAPGNPPQIEFPAFGDWNYYGMRGYMSDLAFFDSALSKQAIEGIYKAGQFPPLKIPVVRGSFEYITETGSFIDLLWDVEETYTHYVIERSLEEFGTYTAIASNVTTLTYRDTDIVAGKVYYYKVTGHLDGRTGVSVPTQVRTYSRHILNFTDPINSANTTLNFSRKI